MDNIRKKNIRIRTISFFWSAAIVFLIEAPSVLIVCNEVRRISTEEINRVGIFIIISFVLMAIFSFGIGLLLYLKEKNVILQINPQNYDEYLEFKQKKKRIEKLFFAFFIAMIPVLGSVEPFVNLIVVHDLDPELVEDYLTWIFALVGVVTFWVSFGIIRYVLTGKIIAEKNEKTPYVEPHVQKKSKRKRAIIIVSSFAVLAAAAILFLKQGSWLLQPYISTIPSVPHTTHEIEYNDANGVYTIQAGNEDFRILQLTDIHIGGSLVSADKDRQALKATYELIEREQPDLVIVTGDIVFPLGIMSFSLNNYVPMVEFAAFMRNIGIPWAVTFGNHDTENLATHNEAEISRVFKEFNFEKTGSLLYPKYQPDITGRSNQMILIRNEDDSVRQAIFLIDSNDYKSNAINDYDYIHDDQVKWYKDSLLKLQDEEGVMPKSLLFFHIPLQEYQAAYNLYKEGSDLVTYHYGKIGEEDEAICTSDVHSSLFDEAEALGSTQGMFVGHDHYNNISLTYRGIRLTYGMSIDYLAMPGIAEKTEQRGGTLITICKDGSFDCQQIPLV